MRRKVPRQRLGSLEREALMGLPGFPNKETGFLNLVFLKAASASSIVFGLAALAGGIFHFEILQRVHASLPPTPPVAAVCLIAAGIVLRDIVSVRRSSGRRTAKPIIW